MMKVNVRPALTEDLDAIASLHMRVFRGFFLPTLGHRFLLELYRGFLRCAEARLLVAEVHGSVAGFVAGAFAPDEFFRNLLLTRWLPLGWAAMGAAMQRPCVVIPRLLAALRFRGERPSRLTAAALLSAIAVDPRMSKLGIGAMLLTAYCDEASKRGVRYVYLTTDRDANDPANRFYVRHSFTVESEIQRRNGRVMIRYVRTLDQIEA